jgi:hypothetical protein
VKFLTKSVMLAAAISASASGAWAADGILIHEKTTSGGTTKTHQIQIDQHRMRAETAGAAGERQAIVFDGTKRVLTIVNYDKKTYSEMTQADVDRLSGQMSDAMAKMNDQMKNLPPEQRARIEAMMAGRGGMAGAAGAAAEKTEYKKTGSDRVGQWTCDKYEGTRGGQKIEELCAVAPQTLGFTAADFAVTRDLQAFFGKLAPQNADSLFRIGSAAAQGFSGVPVRRVTFGSAPSTSELVDVIRQNIPDATFTVPEGFQKEASPFAGRGRGAK